MANDPIQGSSDEIAKATEELQKFGISGDSVLGKMVGKFKDMREAINASADSMGSFKQIGDLSDKTFDMLGVSISNTSDFFKKMSDMSVGTANSLSLLGVALTGTSKLFANMSDTRGLTTLSGQVKEIISDAQGITAPFKAIADALGFKNVNLGNFAGIKTELLAMITNMGGAADKSLAFSRSVFDLAARTGSLDDLYKKAGPNLENLGTLSENYAQKLKNIATATGMTREKVGSYFELLQQVPGILDRQSASGTKASTAMAEFEKMIRIGHGTGQDFNDVLAQSAQAFELYGLKGDGALNMTVRMSELNKNFGLNIKDTRGYINSISESFKMLGDNTDGATTIFNKFFTGLREGGLGIKPAIDTIAQMGESLAHLSLAQKSFISSRSGGPGGLLGGIQMEKDLAAGKSAEVLDKIRQSFTQQVGGKIMTRDQVNTQQDAAEFTRQRQLLQSGPFGNIAKSDEQAAALLKAFASPGSAKDTRAAESALRDSIDKGTNYEKLSATSLQEISAKLDDIRLAGGFTGQRVMQQMTSIPGGALGRTIDAQMQERSNKAAMPVDAKERGSENTKEALIGLGKSIETSGMMVKEFIKGASNNLSSPESQSSRRTKDEQQLRAMTDQIRQERQKVAGSNISDASKQAAFRTLDTREDQVRSFRENMVRPNTAAQVRTAATAASNQAGGARAQANVAATPVHAQVPGKPGEKVDLTVNVYVGDKKHTSQNVVNLSGGVPTNVNGTGM